jgi:hypothetical protein
MDYLVNDASYRSVNTWDLYKEMVHLPTQGDGTTFKNLDEYVNYVMEKHPQLKERRERQTAGEQK